MPSSFSIIISCLSILYLFTCVGFSTVLNMHISRKKTRATLILQKNFLKSYINIKIQKHPFFKISQSWRLLKIKKRKRKVSRKYFFFLNIIKTTLFLKHLRQHRNVLLKDAVCLSMSFNKTYKPITLSFRYALRGRITWFKKSVIKNLKLSAKMILTFLKSY